MNFKCKPTYQFQSIEFDYYVDDNCAPVAEQDIKDMFELYAKVLKGLMEIAPIQDQKQASRPAEPLATEKQKSIMDRFGIKYNNNITAKEAQKLIQASIEAN